MDAHINIPSTVTDIGKCAFFSCRQLIYVELLEGLERIGTCAFRNFKSLRRISIPSTVKRIGTKAFDGCNQLRNVELYEGLE